MLKKLRRHRLTKWVALAVVLTTGLGNALPAGAGSERRERSELSGGRTQRLSPERLHAIRAREHPGPQPDARPMTAAEMKAIRGSGVVNYRNSALSGTLPWHRSFRDINLNTGNLFKNFTDIQIAPARGAGLVLNRSYNSNDDRPGPFGTGWTHAYDIRMEEGAVDATTGQESTDRTDFFGGEHHYVRDADGLYTPPPYLYDELQSEYLEVLVDGGPKSDLDKSMDGTIKHYIKNGTERVCDYIEDRHGNRTTLAYTTAYRGQTGRSLLTTVTDPSGRELSFTWVDRNPSGSAIYRIASVTCPQTGQTVSYEYDNADRLWKSRLDPNGLNRITTYEYTSLAGPPGSGATIADLLWKVTDPLGAAVEYTYSVYSSRFVMSNEGLSPTGTVWAMDVKEPAGVDSGNNARWVNWHMQVLPMSNIAVVVTSADASATVTMEMDWSLRCVGVHDWYPTVSYGVEYDTNFNVTKRTMMNLTATRTDRYTYGKHGNVLTHTTDGVTGTETTEYFDSSKYFQKKKVTDIAGRISEFEYFGTQDAGKTTGNVGEVRWVRDPNYSQTGEQYEFTYNQYGQKASETNLRNVVTQYAYGDARGNLTEVRQDPTGLNRLTTMSYDDAGRVLTSSDPNGRQSTFTYNALGQPESATFPQAVDNTKNPPETVPGETVGYEYHANGRLWRVTDNRGQTTIVYEANRDRVRSVQDPVTGLTQYTYEPGGERKTMVLPGGGTWTYAYTPAQTMYVWWVTLAKDDPNSVTRRLASITDDQGRVVDYEIAAAGNLRSATFNKVYDQNNFLQTYCRAEYTLDTSPARMILTRVKNTFYAWNGSTYVPTLLSQNDYGYNGLALRTGNQIQLYGQTTRTEAYGYDNLNRLTAVDYNDGTTQTYAFDAMGNRLTKTENGTPEAYTYNNANMLLTRGGNGYLNDANGNTLSGGGRLNTWDSQNRMVKSVSGANTSLFTYGTDGIRRTGVVNGTTTHYALDNGMLVREMTGTLTNKATYLVGPRGPEYRRDDVTSAVRWYIYDGLGSVLAEVDPNGNLTATRKLDVYGAARSTQGTPTSKHAFVGSLGHTTEADSETGGLIYMRARWMDPVVGRFVSEDPARDGNNWMGYVSSNPMSNVDRDGRVTIPLVGEFPDASWATGDDAFDPVYSFKWSWFFGRWAWAMASAIVRPAVAIASPAMMMNPWFWVLYAANGAGAAALAYEVIGLINARETAWYAWLEEV